MLAGAAHTMDQIRRISLINLFGHAYGSLDSAVATHLYHTAYRLPLLVTDRLRRFRCEYLQVQTPGLVPGWYD
jgi:hypothetical protein